MIMRRAPILICLFVVVFLAIVSSAQDLPPLQSQPTEKEKKDQGPRAIAVLEWTAKGPRLVPVTIKIDNQFYDASLYMAQPVPMAIESGVVYEVQKAGDSLGDFTLSSAEQAPSGLWVGLGTFDSHADQEKRKQAAEKRKAAAAAAERKEESSDDRPVLKRKSSAPPEEETPPAKPASTPSGGSAQTSATQQSPAAPAKMEESEHDADRPVLRRRPVQEGQIEALGKEKEPVIPKKAAAPPTGMGKAEVAVSDATPTQHHPYDWKWASPEEEQKLKASVEKLAQTSLADYVKKIGGPTPGSLQDIDMQTYDLSYSNAPTVILSARVLPGTKPTPRKRGRKPQPATPPPVAEPGFEYYVTVVGQEDIYGNLQKLYAVATDSKHLDAFSRLQLIGVVDVDGNGVGDLLFRSVSDTSSSFVIYRSFGYSLQEVIRVPEPKV